MQKRPSTIPRPPVTARASSLPSPPSTKARTCCSAPARIDTPRFRNTIGRQAGSRWESCRKGGEVGKSKTYLNLLEQRVSSNDLFLTSSCWVRYGNAGVLSGNPIFRRIPARRRRVLGQASGNEARRERGRNHTQPRLSLLYGQWVTCFYSWKRQKNVTWK